MNKRPTLFLRECFSGVFFFPKPCLKIRGAAYVRVFMVDGEPIAELALPVGLVGTFVTSKSLIEWITRFLV